MARSGKIDKKYGYPINQVLALILGGGKGTRMYPLTIGRCKPAVPFAGNYRLIDIPISNCINSGVNRVFVLTQYNSASLNRHIIQTYKFDIFHNGFVDILASEQTSEQGNGGFSEGTADAVRKVLKHLRDMRDVRYVLIMGGDQLYRMDFRELLAWHIDKKADITIGVLPVKDEDISRFGILKMGEDNRVTGFIEKPGSTGAVSGWKNSGAAGESNAGGNEGHYLGSMGMYLFNIRVLEDALLKNPGMLDFGKELLPWCIGTHRVSGYLHDDYWEDIGTIKSYYTSNMDLTRGIPVFNFYAPSFPFFSKPRFLPPSKIVSTRIKLSIVSDGTILDDSEISGSVIGIRSVIRTGAVIENSIIIGADFYETDADREYNRKNHIPDVGIGDNTVVRNAIIDKNCRIGRDVKIVNSRGAQNENSANYVIVDGIIVIPKDTVIPDGTVI